MFVVVLVVRGDEWKMTLSIAICHPHESATWAACEVGNLWQANKRKAATGLKGEFHGGVLRVLGFYWYPGLYSSPPSPPLVTHHSLLCGYRCFVAMTPPGCAVTTTREHGDITNDVA